MSLLAAIDLLDLNADEQIIVRCLSQQPEQTLRELSQNAQLPLEQTEQTIASMVRANRIVEQLKDGQRVFSVRFGIKRGRVRNAPVSVLNLLDQPPETFLGQALFTGALDEQQRRELLQRGGRRTLLPGEILIWQNQTFPYVGVVRLGLLKRSRLHNSKRVERVSGYVRRGEWFGVTEVLSGYLSAETYIALGETEILLWPAAEFLGFVAQQAPMSMAIGAWASSQLHQQQDAPGQLWAIEGAHPRARVSTVAANLARLAALEVAADAPATAQVLLWRADQPAELAPQPQPSDLPGVDLLGGLAPGDYPVQVEIDVRLSDLQRRYRYILCDSGSGDDAVLQNLRGRATTLVSLTGDPEGAALQARWAALKPFARPGQRRIAVLSGDQPAAAELDAVFQLALPTGPDQPGAEPAVDSAPESPFALALRELYRRLSLAHTIGIFIPSTVGVSTAVDNSRQVQEALAFLGSIFGGATKSESEGVWKSEEHGLVVEQVTIVRSFVSRKVLEQRLDDIVGFVIQLKQAMRQEAIAVDIDNQLVLI